MIYEIHPCRASEKEELKQFIDCHWKKGHALAVSDRLLDFQHRNADGSYNFLIARNHQTGEIDGVFGYIPSAHYDTGLATSGDYFGAVWKVRDDVHNDEIKLLGVYLWKSILKLPGFRYYFTAGISDMAKRFYQTARLTVDRLRQYYILNESIHDYHIAVVPEGVSLNRLKSKDSESQVEIREASFKDAKSIQYPYIPAKSVTFLENRYAKHPYYRYTFYGVYISDVLQVILVTRIVEAQGSRCLRIVDIYGNISSLPSLHVAVQSLLQKLKAEYVDCMNYGIAPFIFTQLGFEELDPEQDQLIIPNYFEPFLQKNVRLECVHTPTESFVIFKGDGDQDRPNILPEV